MVGRAEVEVVVTVLRLEDLEVGAAGERGVGPARGGGLHGAAPEEGGQGDEDQGEGLGLGHRSLRCEVGVVLPLRNHGATSSHMCSV